VLGAYASLTGATIAYGMRISMYYPYDRRYHDGTRVVHHYPDNERRDIAHYTLNQITHNLLRLSTSFMQASSAANICIYSIPQMDLYKIGTRCREKRIEETFR
jgi:hypothetical protein